MSAINAHRDKWDMQNWKKENVFEYLILEVEVQFSLLFIHCFNGDSFEDITRNICIIFTKHAIHRKVPLEHVRLSIMLFE
jgi:hypothetical protein